MLRSEDRASLEAQRKAFRDYMKGSHALPLVLERSEGYTVEAVISPTAFARVRLIVRYIVLSLASISPFCPVKIALYRLLGVKIGRVGKAAAAGGKRAEWTPERRAQQAERMKGTLKKARAAKAKRRKAAE